MSVSVVALLLTIGIPIGFLLCVLLIIAAVVGSFRTTTVERAQREDAKASRASEQRKSL